MTHKSTWQKTTIDGIPCIIPFDPESENKLSNFKRNQLLAGDITGTRRERSIPQLNTYFKACEVLSENTNDPALSTKEKVDWWCRNTLQFFDHDYTFVKPDGSVTFKVRSISFKNLDHAIACDYFTQAFSAMADYLGVDPDSFIYEVKSRISNH